jgi:uncharacterized protein (DUF983 family)
MSATTKAIPDTAPRPVARSMLRGLRGRCPCCGQGRLFGRFLKAQAVCTSCGEDLSHQRADDFPAYIVMFILGHLLVPVALAVEIAFQPSYWVHAAIWGPLTIGLAVGLLQPVKGAVIGLQWALRMHGFGSPEAEAA